MTGAGLGGGASACSAEGTGDDDVEFFDSMGVAEGGGACLKREKEKLKKKVIKLTNLGYRTALWMHNSYLGLNNSNGTHVSRCKSNQT